MLAEGLVITVIGMSIVFIFLELMVILMKVLAGVVRRFFPEPEETAGSAVVQGNAEMAAAVAAVYRFAGIAPSLSGAGDDREIAAAVAAVQVLTKS